MMRSRDIIFSIGILALFVRAQGQNDVNLDEGCLPNGKRPVIFVPGFVSTVLLDSANNNSIAFPVLPPVDLTLPLTWSPSNDTNAPPGTLVQDMDTLVPGPPIFEDPRPPVKDFFGALRDLVEEDWGTEFLGFGWDFRRDLIETAPRLAAAIKDVADRNKCRPLLVCHSLGGLLGFGTLNSQPGINDYVQSVLYAAVPFAGTPIYLTARRLTAEDDFTLSPRPAITDLSFTGLANTLPVASPEENARLGFGYIVEGATVVNGTASGPIAELDYLDIETWKTLEIGPFSKETPFPVTPVVLEHFQNILDRTRAYAVFRTAESAVNHPPAAVLASGEIAWPESAALIGNWTVLTAPAASDGTVLFSATMPTGLKNVTQYNATEFFEHDQILRNIADVRNITSKLLMMERPVNASEGSEGSSEFDVKSTAFTHLLPRWSILMGLVSAIAAIMFT